MKLDYLKGLSYFVYRDINTAFDYKDSSPGILDINRLLHQKPPWRQVNGAQLKKRTLILADWTAETWSEEKNKQVQDILKILLQEGFAVYLWQDGLLEPLSLETCNCLERSSVKINDFRPA